MGFWRAIACAAVCLTVAGTLSAETHPGLPGVSIAGQWRQGAVLIGQAPAGSRVWFDGRPLRLTEDGRFVFGLGRDAPPAAELRVQLPGAAEPVALRETVASRHYRIQHIDGLPPRMVSPPPEVQQRIADDARRVALARKRDSDLTGFEQSFIWPCEGRISGVFGSQRILNGKPKQPHYGVDVAVPVGTPVRAPASGVISLAEKDLYYTGGTLMIDHGHGLASAFLHLSRLLVKAGDMVEQGQIIAESGMSGRATGPHLDWRVNWFDARVDAQMLVPPMPATPVPRAASGS